MTFLNGEKLVVGRGGRSPFLSEPPVVGIQIWYLSNVVKIKMVPLSELTNKPSESQLDTFRRQASFRIQNMRLAIEDPERTAIKMKVWTYLESDPAYWPNCKIISSNEEKHETAKLLEKFRNSKLFDSIHSWDYKTRTRYLITLNQAVEMLNPNLSIKFALGVSLFANALLCLGSQRHLKYYKDVWRGKILCCLAITELAHGSDTKRLKTTATYDHLTNEIILNTPNIGAAKCWVGNLGIYSTHALLFAQLIVDNTCHGLHAFIVPIRDPETHIPYPNITVGDIGEKAGLHGIDNGYVIFHHYRIPKDFLLNKIGDINENGEYESAFTNPQELLGAALESLSAGRVAILQESSNTLIKAVVIAIRYAAQRLQFSDSEGRELPLLEYQTHQWRLFPYVAASYAFKSFMEDFDEQYINLVADSREGRINVDHLPQMVKGIHALVCTAKALITWTTQTAIQECREACGGHGYHKAAGFGDLRSNHDPRVTFEGDNTVLIQQTSNWILRLFSDKDLDCQVFPLTEVSFIKNKDAVIARKYNDYMDVISDKFIMETYEWLICWLSRATLKKIESLRVQYRDKFLIRNQCQVFKSRTLALVFAEYLILTYFNKKCKSCSGDVQPVLIKLFYLYGLWSLHKHLAVLYQGGYCEGPSLGENLSEGVLSLCSELKPEVVSLVDAVAPPDFVLNSILGCSDGKEVKKSVPKEKIKGIGFDATCSLVVVDNSGIPVSVCPDGNAEQNIILWMDHRAETQANIINSLKRSILKNVGGKISLEMELPKLLWLKENLNNQCWSKAGKFFDLPDFLTWKATGCETRSLCSVTCKWLYEVTSNGSGRWNKEFLQDIGLADLTEENFKKIGNEIKQPGEACGLGLKAEIAEVLDLLEGTPVGTSIIDAHAGGLGLIGCQAVSIPQAITSRLSLICGTSTCHMAVSKEAIFVSGVWGPYWSAMVPGLWLNEAGQSASGCLIDHIISTHPATPKIKLEPGKHIVNYLNVLLKNIASKKGIPIDVLCSNIHILPDFHGNRSPLGDPSMKGMICGLDLSTDEEQLAVLYLATIQALAYGTKHIMEKMVKEGYEKFSSMLICGGLSKNPLFVQTHANVASVPVLIPDEAESVLLGASILGATASGVYGSVTSAIDAMAGKAEVISPQLNLQRFHEVKYKVFLKMLDDQLSYREIMSAVETGN